jgi:serine/threonine-protein kinase RsbW
VPREIADDVTLACSEACANAIEHARHAHRQLVEIEAHQEGAQLELRVREFGSWNKRRRSELRGRGLRLIRELMDAVEVDRRADGTEIVMKRTLVRAAEAPGPGSR